MFRLERKDLIHVPAGKKDFKLHNINVQPRYRLISQASTPAFFVRHLLSAPHITIKRRAIFNKNVLGYIALN
jgi:hypothetical protein